MRRLFGLQLDLFDPRVDLSNFPVSTRVLIRILRGQIDCTGPGSAGAYLSGQPAVNAMIFDSTRRSLTESSGLGRD